MDNYFLRPENSLIGLLARGWSGAKEELDTAVESLDPSDEIEAYNRDTLDPDMGNIARGGKGVKQVGEYAAEASTGLFNAAMPNWIVDPVLGAIGTVGGKAARAVTDAVSPVVDAIASSPTGQMIQKEMEAKAQQINQKYPEAAEQLGVAKDYTEGALNTVGSFGALQMLRGKWLNTFAGNTNTKLEGFYGGGKVGQILGAAGVLPTAARRTVQEYFSPTQIQALKQTGIPLGTYEQTLNHLHLIHKGIDAKTYANLTKSMTGLRTKMEKATDPKKKAKFKQEMQEKEAIRESLRDTLGRDNLTPEKLTAMAKAGKEAGSYQGGIESYQMLLNMQTGKNPEMAKLLFGSQAMAAAKVSEGGINNIWDFAVKNGAGDIPDSVKQNMARHTKEAWGISDKNWQNTHIVVKNPIDQHKGMGAEIINRNPTGQFMKALASKLTPEQLRNPEIMQDVFKLYQQGNFNDSRSAFEKTKDKLFGKPPSAYKDTSSLIKEYVDTVIKGGKKKDTITGRKLNAILNPKPRKEGWTEETSTTIEPKSYSNGVRYDAETGNFTFSGSHGSSAKELGGVNVVTVYNVKTGDFWQQLSDEHDMFGKKPVDGDNLVTIIPPIGANINDLIENKKKTKGKTPVGYAANNPLYKEPIREAAREIEAKTGVAVPENRTHLSSMGMTPEQMQIAQVIAQTRNVTPTVGDRLTSAGRVVKGASMFNVLSQQEEENQR